MDERIIIGIVEKIVVQGSNGQEELLAKIDTGATKSSIDSQLAGKLYLGPITKTRLVKSAHGNKLRPVIEVTLTLAKKKVTSEFTIADRRHMKYKVLIGQNTLQHGYIIDPSIK
ncbi:MAG: RimK/LysX family protein [archaeon]